MMVFTAFSAIATCRFTGGAAQASGRDVRDTGPRSINTRVPRGDRMLRQEKLPRHDDSACKTMLQKAPESADIHVMTHASDTLPETIEALRALIVSERARHNSGRESR